MNSEGELDYLDIDDIVSNIGDDEISDLGLGYGMSSDLVDPTTNDNMGFNVPKGAIAKDSPFNMSNQSSAPVKFEGEPDSVPSADKPAKAIPKTPQPHSGTNAMTDVDENGDNDGATKGSNDGGNGGTPADEVGDDFILEILQSKGIVDPSKIPFFKDDESDEIEYKDFNDLDRETQLNILTSIKEEGTTDVPPTLNEDEGTLIQYLRDNELTVQELLDRQREQIIEELGEQIGRIDFDTISDEELYVLEMRSTYEIDDEQANESLELEKQNPELFKKKIDKLRNDYKHAEIEKLEAQQYAEQAQKQQEYEEYGQQLFEVAATVDNIGGLTLDDDEKSEILNSVLDLDGQGSSKFTKLFEDKEALFRMAWFALKGEEAFSKIHSYYKEVIDNTRKEVKKAASAPKEYKVRLSPGAKQKDTAIRPDQKDNNVFNIEEHI